MQTLEIISVNLWQILISLANLLLIFLILKKVLWKPVKKVMAQRQEMVDKQFADAAAAEEQANADRAAWAEKLAGADEEAKARIADAAETARRRSDKLLAEAKEQADGIIRRAQNEAELERRKAADGIKREIVEVSGVLTEKLLGREINTADHRGLIDSFIEEIGDGNG